MEVHALGPELLVRQRLRLQQKAGSAVRWMSLVTPTSSRSRYPSRSRTVTAAAPLSASWTARRVADWVSGPALIA
jgi:hypothetical protein